MTNPRTFLRQGYPGGEKFFVGCLLLAELFGSSAFAAESASDTPAQGSPSSLAKWDLWSLKPLSRPAVPSVRGHEDRIRNPIDAFIANKLEEKQLSFSRLANRSTLIRRLYFDLVGLPPTPEEVEKFQADENSEAYEHLVEQLLASPRYGERWARHWLDIVHYGETHGYDKDKPRPNAWPYRDYVIRALNEDKPYSRFVQEQLAGDVLFPWTRDGIEALGFISAGPWDFIGHEEVSETKIDGKIARHLDRDDMVMNTMQTFNSLTVQCAQCHNHKFDPITQEDYYSLQAVFAAVDRTNKKYDIDPAVAQQRAMLEARKTEVLSRTKEINERVAIRAGASLTELDRSIAALEKIRKDGQAFGYHSGIESKQEVPKWVQVDLGHSAALSKILLHPSKDDFNGIGEGFGFPVRFRVEVSDDAAFKDGVLTLADSTAQDVPNPGVKVQLFDAGGRSAQYVRVTAMKLALRQNDFIFALAELEVQNLAGTNVALASPVTALDSIEAPVRWQKANLTDGLYPGGTSDSSALIGLRKRRSELLEQTREPDEKLALAQLEVDLAEITQKLDKLPTPSVVYVGAVHSGSGAFAGTGARGGKPRVIQILNRGNVQSPGKEVGPGALEAIPNLPARFSLPEGHSEGERRAALAKWIVALDHPLTWRSIVNRIWQYHFGRGIVDTPNDFGRMGTAPTHPELLDWLAVEFRDSGQSFKHLHKLIVTSTTYRQSAGIIDGGDDDRAMQSRRAIELDADNRYLWRMNRRKLDAEAVRDSLLFVAGKLDTTMGGPGFQDFVIDKPEHSPHYEYHLHDPDDPRSHRRSIYRFLVRSQPQPFMSTLDCADPSMQVAKRNESVSPLQALALLNNALVLTMSKHFATKIRAMDGSLERQVARAHMEALGRPPSSVELSALVDYARDFGLENLGRLLFNLNEFAFID